MGRFSAVVSVRTNGKPERRERKRERGYKLCQVSLESPGGMAKGARHLIRALAAEAESMYVMSSGEYRAWAYAALSVALQSGNGLIVNGGLHSALAAPRE